ncbi:30S ribosomal protein S8 [Candidatus Vidania fulgoroideorum]
MFNFHVSDLVNRINNCLNSGKGIVFLNKSNFNLNIVKKLISLNLVSSFFFNSNNLIISINKKGNKFLIKKIRLISKPGRRIYLGLKKVYSDPSFLDFYSTNIGIITSKEVLKFKVSGEFIFRVFLNV